MAELGRKMWIVVDGEPLLQRSLVHVRDTGWADRGVLVVRQDDLEPAAAITKQILGDRRWTVAVGGASRAASVRNGLTALQAQGARGEDLVLIHDGARPFISASMVGRVVDAAGKWGAAIPVIPVADTVKTVDPETNAVVGTVDRRQLGLAQTPQGFVLQKIVQAHQQLDDDALTDDAEAMERTGHSVAVVAGEVANRKITTPADLGWLSWWLTGHQDPSRLAQEGGNAAMPAMAIGQGVDVHPLVTGRPLILGGVSVSYHRGPQGDSDGDVLCHAVIDALLGASHLGDMGTWFRPDDPAVRGARSLVLLRQVMEMVRQRGFRVANVDSTVIADQPRLAPYREAMESALEAAIDALPGTVAVKAKTADGLGILGRSEAIAATAVVLLVPGGIQA